MKNDPINKLLEEAMHMNVTQRAILIEKLLESLDNFEDSEAEVLWQKEIQIRFQDIKVHKVKMVPWEEVKEKLQGKS